MFDVVNAVPKSLANPFKQFSLDDFWSRFNRIYLFSFCLIAGLVVTINDYAGNKIECHGFQIFEHMFHENYCWTQGLYTIKEAYDVKTNVPLPYPGVVPENIPCLEFTYANGSKSSCDKDMPPLTRVYHLWYQWIPFYFWICAVVFYVPYMVFHHSDIGSLKPLLKLLANTVETEEEERSKMDKGSKWLANRLHTYMKAKGPIEWLLVRHKFFFIEVLMKISNFLIVVLVAVATDRMFTISRYSTYGYDWIVHNTGDVPQYHHSPIDKLFPKMVACEIKKWGTTGIVNEAGMCVLAPNVVNSYFFLIFWFVLLLGIAFNVFSVLFTSATHLFTLGQWKALIGSKFIKGNPQMKWVFFTSGTSGQITLGIIAHNTAPRTFEKLIQMTTEKLVHIEKNDMTLFVNQPQRQSRTTFQ